MKKPVIGVLEYPYTDCDGDLMFEVLSPVITALVQAGARPVGIYPTQTEEYQNKRISEIPELTEEEKQDLIDSISMCDGIIKPGAVRIYGFDRFVYEYVLKNNIPFLGICAGMQVMAAYGKDSVNNIKIGSDINHRVNDGSYVHSIDLFPGKLKTIIGRDSIMVSSKHRYQISDCGVHRIAAAAPDGVIEAIENPDCDFNIGLQWHPEYMPDDEATRRIFRSFVESAAIRRQ